MSLTCYSCQHSIGSYPGSPLICVMSMQPVLSVPCENHTQLSADDKLAVSTFCGLPLKPYEQDPNGRLPNEAGAKLDAGKNRLGLVLLGFAMALQEVGRVGTYGATKYTDNGWMDVPDGERRYTDAMLRHLMKEGSGELIDPDTNMRHAAHAAWNALARLELSMRDCPKKQAR